MGTSGATCAPPQIATLMIPEPSAARSPSFSHASVKIVGNMIEFISPTANNVFAAVAPPVKIDTSTSMIAPIATPASTLPGLNARSTAEPMKRPTIAPPQ